MTCIPPYLLGRTGPVLREQPIAATCPHHPRGCRHTGHPFIEAPRAVWGA